MNIIRRFIGLFILFAIFIIAAYLPEWYFKLSDQKAIDRQVVIDRADDIDIYQLDKKNHLQTMTTLLENSSSKKLLAIQKYELNELELNKLSKELNKLTQDHLIDSLSVEHIKENLIYIAYYNVFIEDQDKENKTLKAFKFSDYDSFEYTFWMDGETDQIYEVTLIDQSVDFSLIDTVFMAGMASYFELDLITPMTSLDRESIFNYEIKFKDYIGQAVYSDFSIYNPSTASFVTQETGVSWRVFKISLNDLNE